MTRMCLITLVLTLASMTARPIEICTMLAKRAQTADCHRNPPCHDTADSAAPADSCMLHVQSPTSLPGLQPVTPPAPILVIAAVLQPVIMQAAQTRLGEQKIARYQPPPASISILRI